MGELFRYQLEADLDGQEKRRPEGREYWARVQEWEERLGKPFGEIVHELRLTCRPTEIPERLGVSRSFLYENFGWAMDKIAYLEREYGMPLGQVVSERKDSGVSISDMAAEWGLAVTTLYNAAKRDQAAV